MNKLYFILLFSLLSNTCLAQTINLEAFGPTFSNPVELSHAGDSRLFVVEQDGVIKILNSDGTVNAAPFLDIDNLISSGGERGLLGLAFAPDYNTTGRFYVNYTNNSGDTEISRYTVSANPDIANSTGTILLTIPQPFSNHNGGKIAFGPDGYLYIGTGDGGSGGDPGNRAQDLNELLGKLLRIDVNGATYSIPTDNPFANGGGLPEIYGYGLRNPWKFSFDTVNNNIWIADVGQSSYEEINKSDVTSVGLNYGWRCYEGNAHPYNNTGSCPTFDNTVAPVSEYDHSGGKCSITGGYIYRGSTYPNFYGKYFFADYCSNEIGVLTNNAGVWNMNLQTPNITQFWTTFGEDSNGELYIAGGGRVYKFLDPSLSATDYKTIQFDMYPNPTDSILNIKLSSHYQDIKSISIYNLKGQKIKSISPTNHSFLTISTKDISRGVYLVEILANNGIKAIKKLITN